MNLLNATQYLERRQFFDYERLFATDLNDDEAFHRQMRWLHNSSLHQPGVGNGYKVTGNKGDRQVLLGPGYALDAMGREIVLVQPMTLPVPPVADDGQGRTALYYLAVAYPDAQNLIVTETRQGLCGSTGAVRLAERPALCWVQLTVDDQTNPKTYIPAVDTLGTQIDSGMLIVLAMIGVFQCQLTDNIVGFWLTPRRSALPPRLPYTASGIQSPPVWNPTILSDLLPTSDPKCFPCWLPAPFSLKTVVDHLPGAIFGAIPRYLVRLSGDFLFGAPPNADQPKVFVDPVINLELDQGATNHLKFTFSVTLMIWINNPNTWLAARESYFLVRQDPNGPAASLKAIDNPQDKLATLKAVFEKHWSIVWVGIEG